MGWRKRNVHVRVRIISPFRSSVLVFWGKREGEWLRGRERVLVFSCHEMATWEISRWHQVSKFHSEFDALRFNDNYLLPTECQLLGEVTVITVYHLHTIYCDNNVKSRIEFIYFFIYIYILKKITISLIFVILVSPLLMNNIFNQFFLFVSSKSQLQSDISNS